MNLIEALSDLVRSKGPHLLAIDGPAGAGKTTLADELKRSIGVRKSTSIIHLDDIYNGWKDALGDSLTQSLTSIVQSHFSQKSFSIDIYDWATHQYSQSREMKPAEILIIEGVGSAQEVVREKSLATIWVDIDPMVGLDRVIARDGEDLRDEMAQWQITQRDHFAISKAQEFADFVVTAG